MLYIYVCERVAACVRPARVGVCMGVHACSLAYPACNSYSPYCDAICSLSGSAIFLTFHKWHDLVNEFYHLLQVTVFYVYPPVQKGKNFLKETTLLSAEE